MKRLALALLLPLTGWGADDSGAGDDGDIMLWHNLETTTAGDTYTIDNGTYSWADGDGTTHGLAITKQVTIRGESRAGVTIEIDDGEGTAEEVMTVATDNSWAGPFRLQTMTFANGTATKSNVAEVFQFNGTGDIAIEDIAWGYMLPQPNIRVAGAVWGVFADCDIVVGAQHWLWFFNGETLRDGTGSQGDETWMQDAGFGGAGGLYIEDCNFTNTDGGDLYGVADWYGAAQGICRYNTFDSVKWPTHGTLDGSGRARGPRRHEIYNNTITNTDAVGLTTNWHLNRGGPAIYYNNTMSDFTGPMFNLNYYRLRGNTGRYFPFPTYGLDQWTVQESGTATAPTAKDSLFDSGAPFSVSEYEVNTDSNPNYAYVVTLDSNYTGTNTATISSVDTGADTIDTTAAHGFSGGEMVSLEVSGGTRPGGTSGNTVYFVSVSDTDTLSLLDAPSGSTIDLTAGYAATVTIEELGNTDYVLSWDVFASPIADNTTTVLTGENASNGVWAWGGWIVDGVSYDVVSVELGLDQPGAGKTYAPLGTATWKDGLPGQVNSTAMPFDTFTTDFGSDANRLVLDNVDDWGKAGFDHIDARVRVTTTGTLPTGLSADTTYWIVEYDANGAGADQIEISASESGAPVTLTGDGSGTHTVTLWLDQDIEGVYSWGNTNNDGTPELGYQPSVSQNIHGFSDEDGGVASGTFASRPAASGVVDNSGYWATDTETLYVERDDAWVEWWSEYTYPHPLRALASVATGTATFDSVTVTGTLTIGQ